MRTVLAVVAGFMLWSLLWLSYNAGLRKFALVPADVTQPFNDTKGLLLLLAGSLVMSAIAGYAAASIAHSATTTAVTVLGVLLLAVGIFFQSQVWGLMPLWYHCLFLALLIPLCFIGAKFRLA